MSNLPAMTFGQFIKARRNIMGYSLSEAAHKIKSPASSVRKWELDQARPFASNLYKIAAAYELTANDLEPYALSHKKVPTTKPVEKVLLAIRNSIKVVDKNMDGGSPFEQKMRAKLLASLSECSVILDGVKFLDDAF